jgi:recombination protein RecA
VKKTFTRKRKSIVEQVEKRSRRGVRKVRVEFLDTGSTLLNLALSGKGRLGGWARGRIVNPVGDGSSGKTLLALEACAQAYYYIKDKESVLFPKVKKVSIVYNNREGVMDFPLEEMYGSEFVKGVEWIKSSTCQEFGRDYQRRVGALKLGEFLLYVADSLDSFDSAEGKKRIEKSIKADKDIEGTYGMEKAAYFSKSFFSHLCDIMEGKDATLMCISQVRDNINAGLFAAKHKRVGGKALDFYTHQVPWLAVKEKLDQTVRKQKRVYGITVKARIKRNKTAKPFREAEFDILFDYGIDNIGSIVKYLGYEDEYIETLENDPDELVNVIQQLEDDWQEIEEKIKPKRKERFGL